MCQTLKYCNSSLSLSDISDVWVLWLQLLFYVYGLQLCIKLPYTFQRQNKHISVNIQGLNSSTKRAKCPEFTHIQKENIIFILESHLRASGVSCMQNKEDTVF